MIPILKSPDLVAVVIEKNSIVCGLLRKSIHKPYTLHHYTILKHMSLAQTGSLLNTTLIGNYIANFIRNFKLTNNFISIIAADQLIQEGFANTTTISAHSYLKEHLTLPHTKLHTMYLGPYEEKFLHWWHRVNYPLVMQIHTLAYKHKLNIIRISSPFPLLLELYKNIRGASFHSVQLITDLEKHNFDVTKTYNSSLLNNFLQYDQSLHNRINTDTITLLIGAALYEDW